MSTQTAELGVGAHSPLGTGAHAPLGARAHAPFSLGPRGLQELPCNGRAVLRSWAVFPGVDLVKMEFETGDSFIEGPCESNLIDIRYCLDGASEMKMLNRSMFYLREGELCVNTLTNKAASYSFPTGRFVGIDLIINLDALSEDAGAQFSLFGIDVGKLAGRPGPSGSRAKDIWFHGMAPEAVRRVAEDMFSGPAAQAPAYLRLKTLELLYHAQRLAGAGTFDPSPRSDKTAGIANHVKGLLTADLSRDATLGSLLERSGIGERTARDAFKRVYGCTIGTFLKRTRMEEAARLLAESDFPIGRIAGLVGYANASKFSSAFRGEYGLLPRDYRAQHRR